MKKKPKRGQRYFPNNWRAIKECPDKFFASISYEDFEDMKIYGYIIPDSVFAIIRMKDEDGKYQEKFYNTERGARQCLSKCMKENKEITMCTMDGTYHLQPDNLPTDPNNL